MSTAVPVFDHQGEVYQADSCQPLIDAAEAGRVRLEAWVHGHYPGRKLPRGALRGLKSVGYWDAICDQEWGLEWHRNEGIELTFLETGSLEFAVDDVDFDLNANSLTITRPWQLHRVGRPLVSAGRLHWMILDLGVRRPNQDWRWPSWLVLSKDDLADLTQMLRHNEQPVWPGSDDLADCFKRIGAVVEREDDKSTVSKLAVLLNELLLLLLEMLRSRELVLDESLSDASRSVALFLEELASDPGQLSREWTVRDLAAACGLGVTQFIHYCRRQKNLTPAKYLNLCRLNAAARMLADRPHLTVTQVAFECGFSSSQYFATAFHRQFGVSPSEYRAAGCPNVPRSGRRG